MHNLEIEYIDQLASMIIKPESIVEDSPAHPGLYFHHQLDQRQYLLTVANLCTSKVATPSDMRAFLVKNKELFDTFEYIERATDKDLERAMTSVYKSIVKSDRGIFGI